MDEYPKMGYSGGCMKRLLTTGFLILLFLGAGCDTPMAAAKREREGISWEEWRSGIRTKEAKEAADAQKERARELDDAAGDKFRAQLKRWSEVKQAYLQQNPGLKPETAKAIRESGLALGMTKYEVTLSWLEPDRTNETVSPRGREEQCIWDFDKERPWLAELMQPYGPTNWFSGRYYLYFSNGVLQSWQH